MLKSSPASTRDPSWEDIFDWLTQKHDDLNFFPRQEELSKIRQNGTGEWFLEEAQFMAWMASRAGVLACYGERE